jgi:hypothetical protein
MQERQAEALRELLDTVSYGRDLAAVCALRDRLAERESVRYTLSPLAEAVLGEASPGPLPRPGPGRFKRFARAISQRLCDAIDEPLYGPQPASMETYHEIDARIKDLLAGKT